LIKDVLIVLCRRRTSTLECTDR